MTFRQALESKLTFDREERYFAGALGATGLIIEAARSIVFGKIANHQLGLLGVVLMWVGLLTLQILTVIALKRRLSQRSANSRWLVLLLADWIGYDLALMTFHNEVIWLPLLYGFSQALFLFNSRKPKSNEGCSASTGA